jgi:hypothetical protein
MAAKLHNPDILQEVGGGGCARSLWGRDTIFGLPPQRQIYGSFTAFRMTTEKVGGVGWLCRLGEIGVSRRAALDTPPCGDETAARMGHRVRQVFYRSGFPAVRDGRASYVPPMTMKLSWMGHPGVEGGSPTPELKAERPGLRGEIWGTRTLSVFSWAGY